MSQVIIAVYSCSVIVLVIPTPVPASKHTGEKLLEELKRDYPNVELVVIESYRDFFEQKGAAENLSHVARRWPNFRDWLISKSGENWTAEATRGRAEGEGINVEALSGTAGGNLIIGFRGPLSGRGGALALEIKMPASPEDEPVLVRRHLLPPLDAPHIPKGAARTLRGMRPAPGEPGEYYVLLGPIGYEKEEVVLAHWNANTGTLSKATLLPKGFVAEGVAPIGDGKVLVVDDLKAMILIATEH